MRLSLSSFSTWKSWTSQKTWTKDVFFYQVVSGRPVRKTPLVFVRLGLPHFFMAINSSTVMKRDPVPVSNRHTRLRSSTICFWVVGTRVEFLPPPSWGLVVGIVWCLVFNQQKKFKDTCCSLFFLKFNERSVWTYVQGVLWGVHFIWPWVTLQVVTHPDFLFSIIQGGKTQKSCFTTDSAKILEPASPSQHWYYQ